MNRMGDKQERNVGEGLGKEVDYAEGCEGFSKKVGMLLNKICDSSGKIKPRAAMAGIYIVGAFAMGVAVLAGHSIKYVRDSFVQTPIEQGVRTDPNGRFYEADKNGDFVLDLNEFYNCIHRRGE